MIEDQPAASDWRVERQEKLSKTWSLAELVAKGFIEGPEVLTDDELGRVLEVDEDVGKLLSDAGFYGLNGCRDELKYRKRSAELGQLTTEELQNKYGRIMEYRSAAYADTFDDDLPDSFFEPPRKDSDAHIIPEILASRAATANNPTA